MSKKGEITSGIILSYVSLLLGYGISLFYTPIMLRLMGQREYGIYNYVQSFVCYLGLMDFGLGETYIRFYNQYRHSRNYEKVEILNGLFLLLFLLISFITLLCGFAMIRYSAHIFGGKLNNNELALCRILLIILLLEVSITFAGKVFEMYVIANEHFIFIKCLAIMKHILNPLIMIPLLIMGYRSIARVGLSLGIAILYFVLCFIYALTKLDFKAHFGKIDGAIVLHVCDISFFVFIGGIVDQINWNVGKYVLGKCRGAVPVAIFGVASHLAYYFRIFASSVSSVFIPRVNQIVATSNSNQILTDLMIRIGRIQFMILSLIGTGFIFFGHQFCILWAGKDYDMVYPMALCMMLPLTIPLIQNIGPYILIARKCHKARSIIYLIIAIFNLGFCIPLCIKFGGIGCSIATGLSLIIGNGIFINWYYSHIGLEMIRFWREIIKLALKSLTIPVILGILSILIKLPIRWDMFMLSCTGYAIVFIISLFVCGCNTEERQLVIGVIKKYYNANK